MCFGISLHPRRPVLRAHDAPARVHDADRSVRGAVREALGGRPVRAGDVRRGVLERRAARRDRRRPSARSSTWTCATAILALRGRRHGLHRARGHVVGGVHRRRPVAAGRRRARRRGGVRRRRTRAASRRSGPATRPRGRDASSVWPPLGVSPPEWTLPGLVSWWDVSLMLMLGGIPWNCYFQRVLACRTPGARPGALALRRGADDRAHAAAAAARAGGARCTRGPRTSPRSCSSSPPQALPLLLRHAMPPVVALLGLGRDRRRGDVELQRVDPVGRRDVRVERVSPPVVAPACRRGS